MTLLSGDDSRFSIGEDNDTKGWSHVSTSYIEEEDVEAVAAYSSADSKSEGDEF